MSTSSDDVIATARAVLGAGPHEPERMYMSLWMKVVCFVAGVPVVAVFARWCWLGGRGVGGVHVVLFWVPLAVILALVLVAGGRQRRIHTFDLDVVVELPGFAYWSSTDSALVLAYRQSVAVLVRSDPAPMEDILERIDPGHALELFEEEACVGARRIDLELAGTAISGYFRAVSTLSCAGWQGLHILVLGPESDREMLEDLDTRSLQRTRVRFPGEQPRKWRPLARVDVAQARLVR